MNYLHYPVTASAGTLVVVELDKQTNVKLLGSTNYQRYRRGDKHWYYGGLTERSPFRVQVPNTGDWHIVIDLGGYSGTVRASVNVVG